MSRGDASGAMMSLADDEIQKRGFKVLAKSEDYVHHRRGARCDAARVGQQERRSARAFHAR